MIEMVPMYGFGGGGGTSLNFQIVGGTTQPTGPKENMIWINTSQEITSWIFSASEPETAEEGMVWISIGTSSAVEFNALKKHGIQVYPIKCEQWSGSAWVKKIAKCYQNGTWNIFSTLEYWIFKSGTGLMNGITGFSDSTCSTEKIAFKNFGAASSSGKVYRDARQKIDVTAYKTAYFSGVSANCVMNGNAGYLSLFLHVGSASVCVGSVNGAGRMCSNRSVSIDISSISGEVDIGVYATSSATYDLTVDGLIISNIWLE